MPSGRSDGEDKTASELQINPFNPLAARDYRRSLTRVIP
jgi:hypothetical protein